MTLVDADALPLTADYVDALPNGIDSYPACRVRTLVTEILVKRSPEMLEHPGLGTEFQRRLQQSLASGPWMSEALANTVRLLARETTFESDEEYLRWSFDVSREVFDRPVYRVLMKVVSPALVLLGANRRWQTFREGTELETTPSASGGIVRLRFPENLYSRLVLDGFGQAFRASLDAARARNVAVDLVESTNVLAQWDARWE